jgi:hypothetical protein
MGASRLTNQPDPQHYLHLCLLLDATSNAIMPRNAQPDCLHERL